MEQETRKENSHTSLHSNSWLQQKETTCISDRKWCHLTISAGGSSFELSFSSNGLFIYNSPLPSSYKNIPLLRFSGFADGSPLNHMSRMAILFYFQINLFCRRNLFIYFRSTISSIIIPMFLQRKITLKHSFPYTSLPPGIGTAWTLEYEQKQRNQVHTLQEEVRDISGCNINSLLLRGAFDF